MPYTIQHLCISQSPSPHTMLLSEDFVTIKQKHYCTVSYKERVKVTVQLNNSGAALCWQ